MNIRVISNVEVVVGMEIDGRSGSFVFAVDDLDGDILLVKAPREFYEFVDNDIEIHGAVCDAVSSAIRAHRKATRPIQGDSNQCVKD